MTEDRPYIGILLMLGFCLLAPLSDTVAKVLIGRLSLGQLVTVRFGVMALILVPLVTAMGGLAALRLPRRVLGLTILRSALHLAGTACFFGALLYLPIADALAIVFVLPFLMLLAGRYFLNEEVGARRLIACSVGFVGTLMVIQPNFAEVGWPAFLPLAVAVIFTFFMLITRMIAKAAHPVNLQAVSGLASITMMLPVMALGASLGWPGFEITQPTPVDAGLLLVLGLLATVAHLLMTWSLRLAPSTTVAPIQYIEIPAAALFGWLVFRDLPNGLAAVGIFVTIGAGLYVLAREHSLSRTGSAPPDRARPAAE